MDGSQSELEDRDEEGEFLTAREASGDVNEVSPED